MMNFQTCYIQQIIIILIAFLENLLGRKVGSLVLVRIKVSLSIVTVCHVMREYVTNLEMVAPE